MRWDGAHVTRENSVEEAYSSIEGRPVRTVIFYVLPRGLVEVGAGKAGEPVLRLHRHHLGAEINLDRTNRGTGFLR